MLNYEYSFLSPSPQVSDGREFKSLYSRMHRLKEIEELYGEKEREVYKSLCGEEKEIAENYPYSNAKFLVLVERALDDYNEKKKIDEKELIKRLEKIVDKYG